MRGRIISKLLIVILSVMLLNPVLTAGGAYAIDAQRESGVETSMLTFEHMPEELADWICTDNQTQINLDCSDAEELNNLTVINNDGTKTTRFFNRPIKYVENNQIKFIDNSFKKSNKAKSFFTTYKYENSQSDVKLYLPAKIKDGLLMQSGDMNLRLTPVIESNSEAVLKDFTFAGKTQQIAEYANAFGEGAHLQYASVSGGLKENILLESCVDGVFEFKLSIPGYYAILSDRGVKISLYSYDQPDAGPKYVISQPYALDSYQGEPDGKAHVAFDNKYELIQTGNSEYTIKMLIDEDFLQSSDTVYPVLIDPSIAYASSGSIEDTYVCEANGIKYNNDSLLRLGADSDPLYGRMSIYIKNNFMWYFRYIRPENITSVRYYTERVGVSTLSGMSASVYDCTNVHSLSQVTYSQLENSTGALQSNSIVDIAHTLCEFNVTSLTKQWLKNLLSEGGKSYNYGFIIKAAPSTNGYMCLRAADDPAGNYPCFEITYNEDTSIAYGTFYIRNKQSGQYLDVYNLGTASGTSIIQFPFNGGDNQMWQITHQNNGLYTIRPKHAPSMYLQVSGGTNVDNSRVIQGSYNSQYPYYNWWRIIKNANGTYRLIPYISTILALDNNASSANGANILIGDYYGYAYQQWELQEVPTGMEIVTDSITVGQSVQLSANVFPASAYQELTWSIPAGQANMATITPDGRLMATARGSVIVQARTINGIVATKNIYIGPVIDQPANKPFAAGYGYKNMPANAGEEWYNDLLATYDIKYRHEIIFKFNYEEFYQAIQDMESLYDTYTGNGLDDEYWQNFAEMAATVADYVISAIPIIGDIYSFVSFSAEMLNIGTTDMEFIEDILKCMKDYAGYEINNNNVSQKDKNFEIRLLFDVTGDKQIYLSRSPKTDNDGEYEIPYIPMATMGQNQIEVYNCLLNVFSNRAGRITAYKTAPGVNYAYLGWSDLADALSN